MKSALALLLALAAAPCLGQDLRPAEQFLAANPAAPPPCPATCFGSRRF